MNARTPTLYKITELDAAIRNILGAKVYDSLKCGGGVGRPRMHEMAAVQAFLDQTTGHDVDVIRDMLLVIKSEGLYPSECWSPGDDD